MVEYAMLLAQNGLGTIGALAHTAEVWLSRVNWQVVGYVCGALIALRLVTWTLRTR